MAHNFANNKALKLFLPVDSLLDFRPNFFDKVGYFRRQIIIEGEASKYDNQEYGVYDHVEKWHRRFWNKKDC